MYAINSFAYMSVNMYVARFPAVMKSGDEMSWKYAKK